MSKPKKIEKIKNVALVVLFVSTILLLYFFWGDISFDKIGLSNEEVELEIPVVQEITQPYRISVNFGAENYTVIPLKNKDIWFNNLAEKGSILEGLNAFGQTENIRLEEITADKYQESMTYRSIQAEFAYDIPFIDFCKEYSIKVPQSYNGVEYLTAIGYSEASSKSLLLYDGFNEKYYRLATDKEYANFSELINAIEQEGYNAYYPASTLMGVENRTLIPLTMQTNLRSFSYRQDSYVHQTDKINNLAEKFFGENLDFVRNIKEENGTLIYMYGYGDKVLIANTDGSFEFKDKQLNQESSSQSYFEALETALSFVATHGSWESLDGAGMTPYLKDVIINPGEEKGYRFIFGMEANNARLYFDQKEILIVDVILGQVTYYYRNMLDFDQEDIEVIENTEYEGDYSAVNLIAQNYAYIYQTLANETEGLERSVDESKAFEEVAASIQNMEIGYLRSDAHEEKNQIHPAWVVTAKNMDIYFDLYSAEPIGYTLEK